MNMWMIVKFVTENKVALIKALRMATGLALVPAKDAICDGMVIPASEMGQFFTDLHREVERNNRECPVKVSFTVSIAPYEPIKPPVKLDRDGSGWFKREF